MLLMDAANDILRAFKKPKTLPDPLPTVFIRRRARVPCRSWSWKNRLTTALHGHADARSYDQWKQAGRYVRRGEKAFFIEPQPKKHTGTWLPLPYGPYGAPVFGLSQTEGEPVSVPMSDLAVDKWLQRLPMRIVADLWGTSVEAFNGVSSSPLGCFNGLHLAIALGAMNHLVWTHELLHAADRRNETMREFGDHWRKETVAEFGGAVLLKTLGYDEEADVGGCWDYIHRYVRPKKIGVVRACNMVLERTCQAVSVILDTYHDYRKEIMWEKVA